MGKYDTIDHIDQNKRNNALSNLEIVPQKENLRRAVENSLGPDFGTTNIPNWNIRLTDGKREFKSIAKACNDLINETNLTRDEAIRDIYGALIFGIKGKRPWQFLKENK